MDSFVRNPENPLVSPEDVVVDKRFEVIGTFNPAATRLNGETLLLIRVAKRPVGQPADEVWAPVYDVNQGDYTFLKFRRDEVDDDDPRVILKDGKQYLTSISELYVARIDTEGHLEIEQTPFMTPVDIYEEYGLEDPRITLIDDTYYITYTACSRHGLSVRLASTKDFRTVKRVGLILPPNNKDCVLFPEKLNDKYILLHRPSVAGVPSPEIWISTSPDLLHWGDHRFLAAADKGWEHNRIGSGAPPIRTSEGWLLFYHGADDHSTYYLGAMLLDLEEPWRSIGRTTEPLMSPQAPYEEEGFFSGVVFATGVVTDDDTLNIYYGAADSTTCHVTCQLTDLLNTMQA